MRDEEILGHLLAELLFGSISFRGDGVSVNIQNDGTITLSKVLEVDIKKIDHTFLEFSSSTLPQSMQLYIKLEVELTSDRSIKNAFLTGTLALGYNGVDKDKVFQLEDHLTIETNPAQINIKGLDNLLTEMQMKVQFVVYELGFKELSLTIDKDKLFVVEDVPDVQPGHSYRTLLDHLEQRGIQIDFNFTNRLTTPPWKKALYARHFSETQAKDVRSLFSDINDSVIRIQNGGDGAGTKVAAAPTPEAAAARTHEAAAAPTPEAAAAPTPEAPPEAAAAPTPEAPPEAAAAPTPEAPAAPTPVSKAPAPTPDIKAPAAPKSVQKSASRPARHRSNPKSPRRSNFLARLFTKYPHPNLRPPSPPPRTNRNPPPRNPPPPNPPPNPPPPNPPNPRPNPPPNPPPPNPPNPPPPTLRPPKMPPPTHPPPPTLTPPQEPPRKPPPQNPPSESLFQRIYQMVITVIQSVLRKLFGYKAFGSVRSLA